MDDGTKTKFSEFINKPIFTDGPTYKQQFEGRDILQYTIPKDNDIYIFFVAGKGDAGKRLTQALTSGKILDNILISAGTIALTTRGSWKIALIAAPIYGYLQPYVAPGTGYFYPNLIIGDPNLILSYCNANVK